MNIAILTSLPEFQPWKFKISEWYKFYCSWQVKLDIWVDKDCFPPIFESIHDIHHHHRASFLYIQHHGQPNNSVHLIHIDTKPKEICYYTVKYYSTRRCKPPLSWQDCKAKMLAATMLEKHAKLQTQLLSLNQQTTSKPRNSPLVYFNYYMYSFFYLGSFI